MNNILIQNLKAYPQVIFDHEMKVIEAMSQKQTAKSNLDCYLITIENEVANDPELKNETARKAMRKELINNSKAYKRLSNKLDKCEREYKQAQIELEKVKNEFSVAKLEAKMSIISIEQVA